MKQITTKTILKQGEKIYQPVEVNDVIYWTDGELPKDRNICITFHKDTGVPMVDKDGFYEEDLSYYVYQPKRIIAQSKIPNGWKTAYSPVINLKVCIAKKQADYAVEHKDLEAATHFYNGYNSNPNQYTQKDIEKAILLGRRQGSCVGTVYTNKEILEQINQIEVIHIDEQFNILNYE